MSAPILVHIIMNLNSHPACMERRMHPQPEQVPEEAVSPEIYENESYCSHCSIPNVHACLFFVYYYTEYVGAQKPSLTVLSEASLRCP
jgi:hypothetical protein